MSLSQYWKACTKVMLRMPPAATAPVTTKATTSAADPVGRAGEDLQRQPGALELGQQVEPADADDEERWRAGARPADSSRASAKSGRVYAPERRSGAATKQQQDEIAGGVADRVPEHVGALDEHQAGDAEEGGGGEVLAADGGRVEAGPTVREAT